MSAVIIGKMGTANRNPSSRLGRHSGPEVVFSLLDLGRQNLSLRDRQRRWRFPFFAFECSFDFW